MKQKYDYFSRQVSRQTTLLCGSQNPCCDTELKEGVPRRGIYATSLTDRWQSSKPGNKHVATSVNFLNLPPQGPSLSLTWLLGAGDCRDTKPQFYAPRWQLVFKTAIFGVSLDDPSSQMESLPEKKIATGRTQRNVRGTRHQKVEEHAVNLAQLFTAVQKFITAEVYNFFFGALSVPNRNQSLQD